jgi:hypothetical protein
MWSTILSQLRKIMHDISFVVTKVFYRSDQPYFTSTHQKPTSARNPLSFQSQPNLLARNLPPVFR